MYRMGILFWVAKIPNIFWGVPDIPDIFLFAGGGGKQKISGPSLRMKKNEPLLPLGP